jgi:glycosyltransferase involved in cell wall biosynthesis
VKIPKDSSRLKFAFIGTVASYKGMDVLIEAFKPIKNAELWIYGKYSGTPYPEMASENPNISFRGELLQEDKEQAFEEMDVLIAPSIMVDPYPLVIQEAALQKVPVIVSNIGGLAEQVIDGKNGLLFERGNATDLNQKIRYLIDNPQEITRLSGQASPIKSMHKDAQDIENYYRIILEKRAKMTFEKHWNKAEVS